jgi:hypothetical protein
MAGESEKPDEPDRGGDEPVRYRELASWERIAAGVAGLLVLAAGFVTLFLAKNNGAVAVAVAFVGGALLCVMAVQGTPLLQVGGKDFNARLSGRELVRRAEQIALKSPEEARGYLEGAVAARPETADDPVLLDARRALNDREVYVEALRRAVRSTRPTHAVPGGLSWVNKGKDEFPYLTELVVVPMWLPDRETPRMGFFEALQWYDDSVRKSMVHMATGALVVSNIGVREDRARGPFPPGFPVRVVQQWRADDDPRRVRDALEALFEDVETGRASQ